MQARPEDAETRCRLGIALKNQGNLEAAIGENKKALVIKPDFPEAHYNLAIAHKQMGNLEAAIAEYRQEIRINPEFAEAIYNLGVACQQKRQFRDAIDCFYTSHARRAEEAIRRLKETLE